MRAYNYLSQDIVDLLADRRITTCQYAEQLQDFALQERIRDACNVVLGRISRRREPLQNLDQTRDHWFEQVPDAVLVIF
jgi:hypothetical protein